MILVTGASGTLGKELLPRLVDAGAEVRALSRKPRPQADGVTWFVGDLQTGEGIGAAVHGTDVIVHAASDAKPKSKDVAATGRLIDAARADGKPHLVYISIVGVDRHPYSYYQSKLAVEELIEQSGLPATTLRTTQWHQLLDRLYSLMTKSPLVPAPSGMSFQTVDAGEVAHRLVELALGAPAGRVEDFGGPEVLDATDMARSYARAAGRKRAILPIRIPGKTGRGFRDGLHLAPEHRQGTITWDDFLARRFS